MSIQRRWTASSRHMRPGLARILARYVVAKAWADLAFKTALLEDANQGQLLDSRIANRVGDHLVVIENTPATHNMVVCTLCSCYPWDVLGLPPVWYKSVRLPLARREGPTRRPWRIRPDVAGTDQNPYLGFHG